MRKTSFASFSTAIRVSAFAALSLALVPSCGWRQTVSGLPQHEVSATPVSVQPQRKARHIILMIGDGMGAEQVWAAWAANGGKLNIERLPVLGMSRTSSASDAITDSAAGGTALACGARTANGVVGQSAEGVPYDSLARRLGQEGYATGMVVTNSVTDATPAAFYARAASRGDTEHIASQLPEPGFDLVLGGGSADVPAAVVEQMRQGGAVVELSTPHRLPPATERGDYLPQAVGRALGELGRGDRPFFLMVEGSQIDIAGHWNDLEEMVAETMDFDRAVGVVLKWMEAHPDTLLIVTADHQTGGLALTDADPKRGRVRGCFTTFVHNGLAVPVYAAGAGADRFAGVFDNCELLRRVMSVRLPGQKRP